MLDTKSEAFATPNPTRTVEPQAAAKNVTALKRTSFQVVKWREDRYDHWHVVLRNIERYPHHLQFIQWG